MSFWNEEASPNSTPIRVIYYCTRCEDFFDLSPIAPLRCPYCYCDARYIIGPIPTKEVNLNNIERKSKNKYRGKLSK